MYTVTIEEIFRHSDRYVTKTFETLKHFEKWLSWQRIKEIPRESKNLDSGYYHAFHYYDSKLDNDGYCYSKVCLIVNSRDQIEFSEGHFTRGITHCSKEFKEWFKKLAVQRENPSYNFAE